MLTGKRITLRAIERPDLRPLYELRRDVELVTFTYGRWYPHSFDIFEKNYDKLLDDKENSSFVIETDGTIIGSIELHDIDRYNSTAKLGVAIYNRAYLGNGYGRESIALLLDWAFRNQNFRRIWLDTTADNQRAIRAYQACGFVEEGRLRQHYYHNGAYVDAVQMGLLREEWQQRERGYNATR